eukprot:4111514-Amphidinium_carterae.1
MLSIPLGEASRQSAGTIRFYESGGCCYKEVLRDEGKGGAKAQGTEGVHMAHSLDTLSGSAMDIHGSLNTWLNAHQQCHAGCNHCGNRLTAVSGTVVGAAAHVTV